ncbi:O-antigen ligase family protein [Marinobacter sp. chi1]|uniref:O-antigen ligase family protein n=1 Tax=Marinobacter suaedae TaxID=3057675 RepID=A0ABT8W4Q1_9GAMM|nr:O-antigen ligase family protein [Marinobacter sp. chi1]MDO3723210.1 O-antigen ligase family protein [Marinobacter sp. chi1]
MVESSNGLQFHGSVNKVNRKTFAERVSSKVPHLFSIWLLLTVLAPHQDLYKAFFHGILIPTVLILLFTRRAGINWRDPFLLVSLAFFAYASISTFVVGFGPMSEHVRAFRWGVEITFGLLALYIWMPHVVKSPRWWAYLFLWCGLFGALAAVIMFVFYFDLRGRLTGLGALHNPIQAGSILLVYFAIGHLLLTSVRSGFTKGDKALLAASLASVCLAVFLSESRAPIGAMVVYLMYLGVLVLVKASDMRSFLAVSVVSAVVAWIVVALYGGDAYVQQLLSRGASSRLEIWAGYLQYPPASWWFGFGAGTPPDVLTAAEAYWIPNRVPVTHAHNLFIGTLVETGIVGLCFLATMIGLVVRSIVISRAGMEEKIGLFALLGLVFMLTLTGSHTVISSIKAVWLFLWVPVVFILFWSDRDGVTRSASQTG